jgi:uncharacterized protein (DUF427 family)
MKAIWNGTTVADSDATVVVEGNHYFPPESVDARYLLDSDTHSSCPWKGQASYRSLLVAGETNQDAAWFYPTPKDAAAEIKDHFAFWHGVEIVTS